MRQVHIEFCSPFLQSSNIYDSRSGQKILHITKMDLTMSSDSVCGTGRLYYAEGFTEDVEWWPLRVIDREGKPVTETRRLAARTNPEITQRLKNDPNAELSRLQAEAHQRRYGARP